MGAAVPWGQLCNCSSETPLYSLGNPSSRERHIPEDAGLISASSPAIRGIIKTENRFISVLFCL